MNKQIFDAIFKHKSQFEPVFNDQLFILDTDFIEYAFTKDLRFLLAAEDIEYFRYFAGGWIGKKFSLVQISNAKKVMPLEGEYWSISPLYTNDDRTELWIKDDIGFEYKIDKDGNVKEWSGNSYQAW